MQAPDGAEIDPEELTGIVFLPDEHGALLWGKSGTLAHYVLGGDGFVLRGEMQLPEIFDEGDCGLISVAIDPDWTQNGFIYAAHCVSQNFSEVTRYEFRADRYDEVPASRATVITLGESSASRPWHNVGSIGFFPDAERSMWILVGEKALPEHAQDLSDVPPEASVLYQSLTATSADAEVKSMPPLGVQVPDAKAIEMIRAWIQELPSGSGLTQR